MIWWIIFGTLAVFIALTLTAAVSPYLRRPGGTPQPPAPPAGRVPVTPDPPAAVERLVMPRVLDGRDYMRSRIRYQYWLADQAARTLLAEAGWPA